MHLTAYNLAAAAGGNRAAGVSSAVLSLVRLPRLSGKTLDGENMGEVTRDGERETSLGPLLSTHSHTWLYRVIAVVVGILLLLICIPVAASGALLEGSLAAVAVFGAVVWFFLRQGNEKLFLHAQGLRLQTGSTNHVIRWADLKRLDVQWAYLGDPPGFFEAVLVDRAGKRIVLRANWRERESIDQALLELSQYDISGVSGLPR